jgi:pimeloyl-ACP methyl ester carboxylesterase
MNTNAAGHRVELRLDVAKATSFDGPMEIAATVHLPDPVLIGSRPVVIFASPGGGYTRGYFDMHFDGHSGYSEAEYHTAHGTIYVSYDHLGVGDSTTRRIDELSVEMLADANDDMVRQVLERLATGIAEGFPAVDCPFTVGTGQSMGGGVTILMQGRRRTFDAVGILGVSAIHTRLPQATAEAANQARAAFSFTRATPLRDLSVAKTSAQVPDFNYPFHWEDVPTDILDMDIRGGYPMRRTAPRFGSLTLPACAVAMMSPGFFTPEASVIDVPVLIAVGERDVCPDPWREPSAYPRSNDVSVYVVPRMAHMHKFASSRELLWRRIEAWARMVAAGEGLP